MKALTLNHVAISLILTLLSGCSGSDPDTPSPEVDEVVRGAPFDPVEVEDSSNSSPDGSNELSPKEHPLVKRNLLPADRTNPDHHSRRGDEIEPPGQDEDGRWLIGWDHLLIPDFEAPDPFKKVEPGEKSGIVFPESIRALDGQPVSIAGYMVTMRFEDGAVRDFLLSRYVEGCCFGRLPELYEWVFIDVKIPEGAEYSYGTIVIKGTFRLGERRDRVGFVTSLYQIEAVSVEPL